MSLQTISARPIRALLLAVLLSGCGGGGPVVSRGVVRLGFLALIDEIKSARLTGNGSLVAKKDAALRFLNIFMGPIAKTLIDAIVLG